MSDDSCVTFHPDGSVTHTGDAIELYRVKVIRSGLKACKLGIKLNRAYTPTNLFRTAGNITGKTYKRGRYDEAIEDLSKWISAAEAAMPVRRI